MASSTPAQQFRPSKTTSSKVTERFRIG
uniref:Uncharacterized protein n=1 Tax=Tetraselmis sp. GSL018 TaxID=582737 RepID=A0A061SJ29_9CHLO